MTTALDTLPADEPAETAPPVPAAEPQPARDGDTAALHFAIERLEQVLDHETTAIATLTVDDLKELNRRKSLCLLELTRAARPLETRGAPPALRERLDHLRDAIAVNQSVLETHLEAMREIAATIAQSMQERDSDGTYSGASGYGSAAR